MAKLKGWTLPQKVAGLAVLSGVGMAASGGAIGGAMLVGFAGLSALGSYKRKEWVKRRPW